MLTRSPAPRDASAPLIGAAVLLAARERRRGLAALAVVQLSFGLFPVFGKRAMQAFDPRAVACWRIAVGAAVLGGLALAVHGRRALPRSWRDLLLLQASACLGITLNQVFFLEGLARSTANNAGVMVCLIPVFTFAVAAAVGQERFAGRRALGLALALASTLPLFLARGAEFSREHALGNLLMLLNALSYSVYLVISRPLLGRYPALVVIGWAYLLSAWQIPLLRSGAAWMPAGAGAEAWGSLAYVLAGPTILSYLLNAFALARVSASTTAAYVYIQPLVTGVAAWFLLREGLPWPTLAAGIGIFAGLALVVSQSPTDARPAP